LKAGDLMAKKNGGGLSFRPEVIAFLRDIKDNPDDDTPRLILADWLEDRFDPRGQFVRLQVQAAHLPRKDPIWEQLLQEAKAIHEQQQGTWIGPLAPKGDVSFHRGLLCVTVDPRCLLGKEWRALAGTETWEWVETLNLGAIDEKTLVRLAAESSLLPSISSLAFTNFTPSVSLGGLTAFLHAPVLRGLRALKLAPASYKLPVDRVISIIASSSALDRLMSIDLGVNHFTNQTAIYLATSPHLGNLRALDLSWRGEASLWSSIGPEGVRAIADSPFLGRLQSLLLFGNQTSDAGMEFLAASPHLAHLTTLSLACNRISDAGIEVLCASRHLHGLRHLELSWNKLGSRTAHALANCSGLTHLEYLGLSACGLSNEAIRALVEGSGLPCLTELNVNLLEDDADLHAAVLRRFPKSKLESWR
jgi:uncharacterized protein (TIGR02996 family)